MSGVRDNVAALVNTDLFRRFRNIFNCLPYDEQKYSIRV